jgi:hypothetical protein
MGFSLKNSGFSYLYGSISYLFGYENFGCFFLMAAAGREGRLMCRSHAHLLAGALQRERTSRAACWRAPRDLMRRQNWRAPYREKEPRAACWRAPRDLMRRQDWRAPYREKREKPRAPPAGGRRGQVELLAHAYATCGSKQLDSDRLAANVPKRECLCTLCTARLHRFHIVQETSDR